MLLLMTKEGSNAIEYGCCIDIIDTKKSEITDLLLHNSSQFDIICFC